LPNYLEADHRLAATFALTHGYHVYYPSNSGPVLSTLYGPVTVLAYLSASLASRLTAAILIGDNIDAAPSSTSPLYLQYVLLPEPPG
jgi:hypothetical protein